MTYPSLFNTSNSALKNAYLQSLEPLRARLHLLGVSSGDRIKKLVIDCVQKGIGIDEALDRGFADVDRTMRDRVKHKITEVPAYQLTGVMLTPQSTDPADFVPFAGDVSEFPELWLQDPSGDGPTFSPGSDATAFTINGTGNPKCNPRQLTEFVSVTPGENGCIVRVDEFGFRLKPGVHVGKDETEYQFIAKMEGAAWWFERYEKQA